MKSKPGKINLESLTRDQKLQLLDIIEEKKRRARDRKAVYLPNRGQEEVHKSDAILRCVFSGNGAGKTALGVNEALWAAQGYNPLTQTFTKVPARIVVLLDHPEKVTDVWLPEIQKWTNLQPEQLHKRGKPYVSKISFTNGSEILFMFHQQEAMLFESIELDFVIADEPPPRHIYIALRRGGRKKGRVSRYLIIGTPISASWLRTEIYEPWINKELEDTECFRFGTIVNEANLGEGYIDSFSSVLSEKEKRIRLHGEFFDLDGLALAHLFSRDLHTVEPFDWPTDQPVVIAIDPHSAKPHHAVMLGVDRDNYLYYIKEISEKSVARDFARTLKVWYQGFRVIDIVCDSLGSAEYTGGEGFASFIEILNDEGVRARATTWTDKNDEDFIDRIKTVLSIPEEPNNFGQYQPKLRIFKNNHGIIGDIENVQWVKYRNQDIFKPKLDITKKDFLSCLKYALASNLTYNKHKAKIYKRIKDVETYGISKKKAKNSVSGYRSKLGLKKVDNVNNQRRQEEDWEDW